MAKALVKAVDYVNPDPTLDLQGSHKRGDIIVVKPDTHVWGRKEMDTNLFAIVTVPDSWLTDANQYEGLLVEDRSDVVPFSARHKANQSRLIAATKERKILRRHRYSIDLDGAGDLIDRRNS